MSSSEVCEDIKNYLQKENKGKECVEGLSANPTRVAFNVRGIRNWHDGKRASTELYYTKGGEPVVELCCFVVNNHKCKKINSSIIPIPPEYTL